MVVLKFKKFWSLWAYNGIPVYIGGQCITKNWLVWWWPINWLFVLIVAPYVLGRMLAGRP